VREDTTSVKIGSEIWSTKVIDSGEGDGRRLNCSDLVTEKTARVKIKDDNQEMKGFPCIQMLHDTSTREWMT
jgi:hypothetical protein